MPNKRMSLDQLAARYEAFAADEARGSSAIYEKLARAVAGSRDALEFLATLPASRQQPNLLFAAIRHLFGVPESEAALREIIRREQGPIRDLMLSRTTQTNEPGRCAVLLPLLAALPQPLALLEVGASAGLCLLPDRYGYDYGARRIDPPTEDRSTAPVFECQVRGDVPIPNALPRIAWRMGIDLNPIDVTSATDVAWLETLVWPEHHERAQRLRAAITLAKADPPKVVKGNLLTDLEPLMAAAPEAATLVVFHTAVLAYVGSLDREQFAQRMRRSRAIWISNEVPSVLPHIAEQAPSPRQQGRFLLAIDGKPVAWTGPHGQSIDWFAS
jgi:hypothetical protein